MFSVAKVIIIGSGSIAVATGAYVIKAPKVEAPVAQAESVTAIPNSPIFQASSKPIIYSPASPGVVDACRNASLPSGYCGVLTASRPPLPPPPPSPAPPVDPNAGIITIPPPASVSSATTTIATPGCASLANPAWQGNGPVTLAETICSATKTCSSLLKPADASDHDYPALSAGKHYYVTPRTDGMTLPDGAPPAVVAVPADGPIPTTMNQVFPASCFQ